MSDGTRATLESLKAQMTEAAAARDAAAVGRALDGLGALLAPLGPEEAQRVRDEWWRHLRDISDEEQASPASTSGSS